MSEKQIPQHIIDLAKVIKEKAETDKSTGIVTVDEKVFLDTLPDGVDKKVFNQCQEALDDYTLATAYAVGEIGKETLQENQNLKKVVMNAAFPNKNTITHHLERERSGITPSTGKPWTKNYVLTTNIEHRASSTKRGKLKLIAEYIAGSNVEDEINNTVTE